MAWWFGFSDGPDPEPPYYLSGRKHRWMEYAILRCCVHIMIQESMG